MGKAFWPVARAVTMESIGQSIGLGGGCHWCTEAVFASLRGVDQVRSGWIKSDGDNGTESEAVLVDFDPDLISLCTLIEIHMLTHSSQSEHAMRDKYRSAIYVFGDDQARQAKEVIHSINQTLQANMITNVLPFASFRAVSAQYKDYYYSNPDRPFCVRFIEPKLQKIIQTHAEYIV